MRKDPHSYADLTQGRITALNIDWQVDFDAKVLRGAVTLTLTAAGAGPFDLDSRGLKIASVHVVGSDGANAAPLNFDIDEADLAVGDRLRIHLEGATSQLRIVYETSPDATALMWLSPSQTDGGELPFMLSQCQAIHARSIVPLQDSPQVRATYTAHVTIPASLSAVMSAAPGVSAAVAGDASLCRWTFDMPQPIPSYLLAIAVGDIKSADLGPRTRVYAEPGVVDKAAYEFAEAESMLVAAEELFGPYPWERYDFIVLPPSFPFGGMENPRMTFLTPTLLAGDRSLVSVLAHELAHSWTGNLINNATNEDFWLNEGWTVYAERRIIERLYGADAAAQQARLGRVALDETIAERASEGRTTALCYSQKGLDPDAEFSRIPYEKGYLLIASLERCVGRDAFDAFIRTYMDRFRFQPLTTAEFAAFVSTTLPEAAAQIDMKAWLYDDGIPENAPSYSSARLSQLVELAQTWTAAEPPRTAPWSTTETLFFVSQLPKLDAVATKKIGEWLGLRATENAELTCAWLTKAAMAGVPNIETELADFVNRVGRTKLLKPVISAMAGNASLRAMAVELVEKNRTRLHLSTRTSLDAALA